MNNSSLSLQELKELQVIVKEMTEITVKVVEYRANYAAKGIPRDQFNRLVNSMCETGSIEVDQELSNMVNIAESKFGKGTVDLGLFKKVFSEMVEMQQDLMNYRRLISAFDINSFVVNKLVELRSQSPLDDGQGLIAQLNCLAGYEPNQLIDGGIKTEAEEASASFYKKVIEKVGVSDDTKKLVMDILLGVGLGVSGLHLLT